MIIAEIKGPPATHIMVYTLCKYNEPIINVKIAEMVTVVGNSLFLLCISDIINNTSKIVFIKNMQKFIKNSNISLSTTTVNVTIIKESNDKKNCIRRKKS